MGLDPTQNPDCKGFVTRLSATVNRNRVGRRARSMRGWSGGRGLCAAQPAPGWTVRDRDGPVAQSRYGAPSRCRWSAWAAL